MTKSRALIVAALAVLLTVCAPPSVAFAGPQGPDKATAKCLVTEAAKLAKAAAKIKDRQEREKAVRAIPATAKKTCTTTPTPNPQPDYLSRGSTEGIDPGESTTLSLFCDRRRGDQVVRSEFSINRPSGDDEVTVTTNRVTRDGFNGVAFTATNNSDEPGITVDADVVCRPNS